MPEELIRIVNGQKTKILEINSEKEYARAFPVYGYWVQILKPANGETYDGDYDMISLSWYSREIREIAQSAAFVKRN